MFYVLKRQAHAGWRVCEVYYRGSRVRSFGLKVIAEEVLASLQKRHPNERFALIFTEEDM